MADYANVRAMKKSTRKSMPKVRTGCLTCKQRRIKCDEAKPLCRNCSRGSRRCQYPDQVEGDSNTSQEVATSNPQRRLPIRVYNLPFKVPGSQADRQLLHFYCVEAAGGLSSFSDPSLWTNLILQRSHHQPVIRHALVTLAALHRDFLQAGNRVQPAASQASIQRIAKSHRQLRLYLRSPDASPDTPLICSILFFAFETLIGDGASAIQHLNNGLNLLKQYQGRWHSGDDLLPQLTSIFSRLDVQASTFDDRRVPILDLVTPDEMAGAVDVVPEELFDIAHAEAVLTRLQNWMMHHIIVNVAHKHKPMEDFPPDLLRQRFILYRQYERFLFALTVLLNSLPAELSHRAILLRIQARMYHAILVENIPDHTVYPSPPGSFSGGTPSPPSESLQDTLRDIQSFLALDSPEDTPRNFTLCSQLVAILYFISLKTTDVQSRGTALSLLQHPQLPSRDGLWEADKAVTIIRAMMERTGGEPVEAGTLEAVGDGILDPEDGGLEEVFQRVNIRSTRSVERSVGRTVEPTDSGP